MTTTLTGPRHAAPDPEVPANTKRRLELEFDPAAVARLLAAMYAQGMVYARFSPRRVRPRVTDLSGRRRQVTR